MQQMHVKNTESSIEAKASTEDEKMDIYKKSLKCQ